jgi:hypothetical protein
MQMSLLGTLSPPKVKEINRKSFNSTALGTMKLIQKERILISEAGKYTASKWFLQESTWGKEAPPRTSRRTLAVSLLLITTDL